MLDEKALQAIRAAMKEEVADAEKRIAQNTTQLMEQQRKDTMHDVTQLMEQQRKDIMHDVTQLMEQQRKDIMYDTTQLIKQQRKDIMHDARLLMENEFQPKFNLLAEGQQIILEKLERLDDMEVMDTRISALEAMVKKLNREMEKLKKAQ